MQKISSYHIILSALFALFITTTAGAQERKPVAVSTTNGIWVYLGDEIPKDFRYEVYRKTGRETPSLVGTITYQSDENALKKSVTEYNTMFGDLASLGDRDIARIRAFAEKNTKDDTIAMNNLPVMHLSFGTAFLDNDVKPGTAYQYFVRKVTGKGNQEWQRESNTITFPAKTDIMKPVFSNKEESRSSVLLRWYVPEQKSLNTFMVYRRVFGQDDFVKLNAIKGYNSSKDTIYLIAIDTTVQVPGFYQYYLVTLDIYGNRGQVSDTVGAGTMSNGYNPVPDYFHAEGLEKNHQVQIRWRFRDMKYLRGIEIFRSESFDNGFNRVAILPAGDTSFTDIVPVANQDYWYYLVIDGPGTKSLPTAKISVMFRSKGEKPLPPSETGAESVRGGVKIFWTYNEPYAKGFYVYRYDYNRSEYMQVSSLLPAGKDVYSYVDSINPAMGADIQRYAVKAVNDLDQMSDLSEPASAAPGIKAPVRPPMNPRISRTENGIILIWDDLRNTEPALMGYKVYRKQGNDKGYKMMPNDTLRNDKNYYIDTTLVAGTDYVYVVKAVDYYGNESPDSKPVSYDIASVTPVPPVITRAVSTSDGIMISWGQVTDTHIASVKVYRIQPGGEKQVIATVPADTDQYLDKTAESGQLYSYMVSVVTADNNESAGSREVTVRR